MKSWFIVSGKDATSAELRDVPVPEPKAHMEASSHLGKIILRA